MANTIELYKLFGSFLQNGSLYPPFLKEEQKWTPNKKEVLKAFNSADVSSFNIQEGDELYGMDGVLLLEIQKTTISKNAWENRARFAKDGGWENSNDYISETSDYGWETIKERAIHFDGTKASKKEIAEHFETYETGGSVKSRVWTVEQEAKVKALDSDFEEAVKKEGIKRNSKEASDFWREGGFQKRMGEIFGKKMAKGGGVSHPLIEKLKKNKKLARFVDSRGNGKKVFETIVPNKEEKGYYKRYESSQRGSLGVLQNEMLDESDLMAHFNKTKPKLFAGGGGVGLDAETLREIELLKVVEKSESVSENIRKKASELIVKLSSKGITKEEAKEEIKDEKEEWKDAIKTMEMLIELGGKKKDINEWKDAVKTLKMLLN